MLTCTNPAASKYRNESIVLFANRLRDQRTDPAIVMCISGAFKNNSPTTFQTNMIHTDATPLHIAAAMEQDEIGHINFFFGRVTQKWREI